MLNEDLKNKDDLKRIGFPRVENFPSDISINQTLYRPYIREHMIDMDDPTISDEVKNNIEYVIDISDSKHHKMELMVKPNATRAAEQKALHDSIIKKEKQAGTYANRVDKNMLIIYIDNLSRTHFMRKMPKTAEWLSQFVDNQESDYKTYQFFRYHSVYYNTLFSNDAMYFGEVEYVNDTSKNVFNSFSENGYITGFFKDSCETTANAIHDPNLRLNHWDHFGGGIA